MAQWWCNPHTPPVSLLFAQQSTQCQRHSPMAYIVITYSEKDLHQRPPLLGFCSPLFFPLISIVTILSHARAFLLASCHILLLSSCLEVSLSQAGRVELLWVLPAFARCSFGVGSWQAWQPIPTGPLSCDSSLPAGSLKHPFIPLYKWRHGAGFHFLANLHAIAETKKSHTPTPLTDRLS